MDVSQLAKSPVMIGEQENDSLFELTFAPCEEWIDEMINLAHRMKWSADEFINYIRRVATLSEPLLDAIKDSWSDTFDLALAPSA